MFYPYNPRFFWLKDRKLYIYIDSSVEEADTVVSVKLKNKKNPYNINIKVKNYAIDEGLDD